MNSFKVSYVTTLPKEGNAPRVTITGNIPQTYSIFFYDLDSNSLVSSGVCTNNQTIIAKTKQWYTKWFIEVRNELNEIVFIDNFELQGKSVFIKMDAWALGDSIAWIPYIEVFQKKHNCIVICSTFFNDLFIDAYPNVMFVKPNTIISNIYAQYYIGASNDDNPYYSPIKVNENPLQDIASKILGLEPTEICPIELGNRYNQKEGRMKQKYVTLSEFGSSEDKQWKTVNGWQGVVDYLITKGYAVLVISKEPTNLKRVFDLTGPINLDDRAVDILHAEFHLGVSSGLSWLAWGLGTHVIMISDITPNWHEFQSNITRLNANDLNVVNYLAEGQTSLQEVLKKLEELGVS